MVCAVVFDLSPLQGILYNQTWIADYYLCPEIDRTCDMHTDMRQIDAGSSLGRGQVFVDSFAPLQAIHYVCKGCIVGGLGEAEAALAHNIGS
jgi:hypothetical protein